MEATEETCSTYAKSRRPCAVWKGAFNGVKAYWPLRLGRQSLGQRIEDSVCKKKDRRRHQSGPCRSGPQGWSGERQGHQGGEERETSPEDARLVETLAD